MVEYLRIDVKGTSKQIRNLSDSVTQFVSGGATVLLAETYANKAVFANRPTGYAAVIALAEGQKLPIEGMAVLEHRRVSQAIATIETRTEHRKILDAVLEKLPEGVEKTFQEMGPFKEPVYKVHEGERYVDRMNPYSSIVTVLKGDIENVLALAFALKREGKFGPTLTSLAYN